MAKIKASCSECLREIQIMSNGFHLTLMDTGPARYEFFCPLCHELISKEADVEVVALLQTAGVRTTLVHVPLEALETHQGPQLTSEDLMDFHLAMQSEGLALNLDLVETLLD